MSSRQKVDLEPCRIARLTALPKDEYGRVRTSLVTSFGAGVDVRTVAGRLGHSDPSLTLRVYGHVIEERDRAAAAVMGQLLARVEPSEDATAS